MGFIMINRAGRTMHAVRFDRPRRRIRQLSEGITDSDADGMRTPLMGILLSFNISDMCNN
jgi:hypothetical protein